jgi:hypothetical protein
MAAMLLASAAPAIADDDTEIAPAPPSIGADVPLTYFGPAPSSVKRELVGPYQELKAGKVDLDKGTITLPLYEGALKSGEIVWYIVTDTDDKGNADALGLNYSSKLTFSEVGRAVRKATLDSKFKLVFEAGKVDFGLDWRNRHAFETADWRRRGSVSDRSGLSRPHRLDRHRMA